MTEYKKGDQVIVKIYEGIGCYASGFERFFYNHQTNIFPSYYIATIRCVETDEKKEAQYSFTGIIDLIDLNEKMYNEHRFKPNNDGSEIVIEEYDILCKTSDVNLEDVSKCVGRIDGESIEKMKNFLKTLKCSIEKQIEEYILKK